MVTQVCLLSVKITCVHSSVDKLYVNKKLIFKKIIATLSCPTVPQYSLNTPTNSSRDPSHLRVSDRSLPSRDRVTQMK